MTACFNLRSEEQEVETAMKILVCIKQVPGTNNVEVDPVTGVLKRDGVATKLNPYDLYSLELAMCLRQQYGGTVDVITMGPPQAKSSLLEAVCMGAEKGCLISDRKFGGADVVATSYTLSQGIRKMGQYDLILCGKQTTDGDTAQVGPETAEFLGIPHATNVQEVTELKAGFITVRITMDGFSQVQKMRLPCLLTVEKDINTPRLPSYRRKCMVNPECISMFSLADFDDKNEKNYGLSGSPTQVERIFPPEKNLFKEVFRGSGSELAEKFFGLLLQKKFI